MNVYLNLPQQLYSINPVWSTRNRLPHFLLPKPWQYWLLDNGSLSAKLAASKAGVYRVQVLSEGYAQAHPVEQHWNACAASVFWCREVCLYLGETPVIYARTLMPADTPNPQLHAMRHLASRPLGDYLFQHPRLQRGDIQINRCPANRLGLHFCRHSSFHLPKQAIFIAEGFCQNLLTLAH